MLAVASFPSNGVAAASSPPRPAVDRPQLGRLLQALGDARRRRLTLEEAFIFLAAGQLGLSSNRIGFAVRPVPCGEIATLLSIPKETVRRKAISLEILGLVSRNSRGVAVEKLDDWLELAAALAPRAEPSSGQ